MPPKRRKSAEDNFDESPPKRSSRKKKPDTQPTRPNRLSRNFPKKKKQPANTDPVVHEEGEARYYSYIDSPNPIIDFNKLFPSDDPDYKKRAGERERWIRDRTVYTVEFWREGKWISAEEELERFGTKPKDMSTLPLPPEAEALLSRNDTPIEEPQSMIEEGEPPFSLEPVGTLDNMEMHDDRETYESPDESAFNADTQYTAEEQVPDWMKDIDEDIHQESSPSTEKVDPENEYPLNEFLPVWDEFNEGFEQAMVALKDTMEMLSSPRMQTVVTDPVFMADDGRLKLSTVEYYRIVDFEVIMKYLADYVTRYETIPNEGKRRYQVMAYQWLLLADMQMIDTVTKQLTLPKTGTDLDGVQLYFILGIMKKSYRVKVYDLYIQAVKGYLIMNTMIDFFSEFILTLSKTLVEHPFMIYHASLSTLQESVNRLDAYLADIRRRFVWADVDIDWKKPDRALGKLLTAVKKSQTYTKIVHKSIQGFILTYCKFDMQTNYIPKYDFTLLQNPVEFTIESSVVAHKRTIHITAEATDAEYSYPILEEGIDYSQHSPSKYVKESLSLLKSIKTEFNDSDFDIETGFPSWTVFHSFFETYIRTHRSDEGAQMLFDTREWLLDNYPSETEHILSLGKLPFYIDPKTYEGDYEKRPLSIDELCVLSTENHYRRPGEPWFFDPWIDPDSDTEDEEDKDMFGLLKQRIYETPPVTLNVEENIPPPVFPLRIVLRPTTTKTEVLKVKQLDWVVGVTLRDTSYLGHNEGKRYNVIVSSVNGPKNHIIAWMKDNGDKAFETVTTQWVVTVNSNMTRAQLYSQGKSPDQFLKHVLYFLEAPSEEFVRGRKRNGGQSQVTVKNILRWNVKNNVIEYSPQRGLVHVHALLEVTVVVARPKMINEQPAGAILDYKAFISYMQLLCPGAYVNFTKVKKYLDEQDKKDFDERWENYIKKGMESAGVQGTTFIGVANAAVKKGRGRFRRGKNWEYNKKTNAP